jgi:transcriptional regulator with XRE-family HTH domain
MEPETEIIIENIRKKRLEKGISVLNLAVNTGISNSHLFYIESKRVIPSIDVVVKIAKSMDLDIKDLLPEEES